MTIREAYFGTRRSIEVEVDEGSTANFVTRGMAADWGYEVRSLGSESFLGDTINGNVICGEYIELTLVDEGHQNIVAIFNVLPHNDPPNAPRITKPLIGRQLLQESGHLLLAEDPRDPVWSTKMGKETVRIPFRKGSAAMMVAYTVPGTCERPTRTRRSKCRGVSCQRFQYWECSQKGQSWQKQEGTGSKQLIERKTAHAHPASLF